MKKIIKKVLPLVMTLAMVLSLLPTTVFALTSDEIGTIADGVYTGTANVSDVEGASEDMEDWDWQDYTVNVSVTVENGAITEISTAGTAVPDESSAYWKRATVSTSSRTSVIDQIIEANSTEVDGVSNATYASGAIILAVDDALADEVSTDTSADSEETEDLVYVLMNIPYSDFYSLIGDDGVDSVSSATLNKTRTSNLAGGSYHVNSDGSDITGIIYYVCLPESALEGLNQITNDSSVTISVTNRGTTTETTYTGSDTLFEAESYSYYILDTEAEDYEEPTYYITADTNEEGNLVFSELVGEVTEVADVAIEEFTTDTTYGDYQLNIDSDALESILNGATVSAVTVNTTDGSVYGLRHVENIWLDYELAWSTGHTTTVHGCSVAYEDYADMEGKTIESVTYYTTSGIYVLDIEDIYVTPYSTGVSAELTSSTEITVAGIPEDAENLSVTLSYTSGRSSVEVEASYDAETGVITAAEALLDDTTYTITITADNYAFESLSVDVSYVYVQMNVPYDDFFAAYGVDDAAVWEVEDGLDAVSTATTSKFLGTDGLAAGTYNDGTYILGVVLNVAMLESTYEALAEYAVDADSLASAGSYYFTVLDEEPEYYSVLDYADGTYSFAAIQDSSLTTEYLSVDELTIDGGYGDYQVSIIGLTNASGVQIGEDEYQDVTVYTVIMNFEDADGNTYSYGTTALENLWFGTRVTYLEVAWSIPEGQQLRRAHNSGDLYYQFEGINGATLTGVVIVTDQGVITVEADVDLPEYTSASAANKSDGTIEITGIPEDAENVAVTLSYTEGSGRSAVTTTVAATYENGILTITDADSVTEGTVYTISISADNYAFTDIEIEYGYEYVLMNIPYEVFYAAAGTENVDGVDAISAATSSKYNYYNLAGGSYNSGDADIDGVTYAVKLSAADYEAFVALGYTLVTEDAETVTVVNQRADYDISGIDTLFVQGDYAYADVDIQDSYLTASVADGVITFSALTGEAAEVYVTYDFYTDTSYGDYQLDIDISDYVDGAGEIAAATVNTTDGCTYALLHVEEIWTGGKLAWSTGHTTTVHNNVVNYELYEGMEGKTIESVTYYMTDGTIYTFILSESEETTDEEGNTTEELVASPAYVIPYYTGEIAAESASKTGIVLSGIDELTELTTITGVTVTYSVGSGKNSVTYTVEDAVYADGVITGTFEAGVTYTVVIETEDYAQIEVEATVTEYAYTLYYKCADTTDRFGVYFGQMSDGEYESGAVQITENEDGTYTVVIVVDGTSEALSDVAMIFDDDVVYTSETDEAGYITYTLTLDDITETLDFSFTYTIAAMGMTNTHAFQIVFEGGTWSGHDIVFVEETAADCGNTGVAAHYECSRCGAYFEVSYSVTVEDADALTAVELTVGDPMNLTVTAYVNAKGEFVQEDGVTASMMASYVENVSVTENEDGTYTVSFSLTDEAAAMVEAISADMTAAEADSADYVIAATGEHSYDDGVLSDDGTYITYTCQVCGDTYTEEVEEETEPESEEETEPESEEETEPEAEEESEPESEEETEPEAEEESEPESEEESEEESEPDTEADGEGGEAPEIPEDDDTGDADDTDDAGDEDDETTGSEEAETEAETEAEAETEPEAEIEAETEAEAEEETEVETEAETEAETESETEAESTSAATGDTNNLALWTGLAAFALMGLACIFINRRKFN